MKRESQVAAMPPQDGEPLRPWHLLLVGVMITTAVAVVATRGTGVVNVVFVAVAVLTAGLAAAAAFRCLAPLASADAGEQTDILGGRTRAAVEREKMLVLRSIKEIEFDRAMRKISERDYQEMVTRLRGRAVGLMRQLDGAGAYRELIERDLAKLIGAAPGTSGVAAPPEQGAADARAGDGLCPACATANDVDARFCKACGARLGVLS